MKSIKSAREAAFLAAYKAYNNESFVADSLKSWRLENAPALQDFHLAEEIAYGSVRMALALDYLASKGTKNNKLSLKLKEKALLRTAVFQLYFLDRVPSYAVVNESVAIARKNFHSSFVSFLNAILRNLTDNKYELPKGSNHQEISIRYSYPLFFVEELIADYGLEKAISILDIGNQPSQTIVRIRSNQINNVKIESSLERLEGTNFPIALIQDTSVIKTISNSSSYYIQNATPVALMEKLSTPSFAPLKILDLCASPGGKLLMAHDLYPKAALYANDISPQKIATLQENIHKYGLNVNVSCGAGEEYDQEQNFDLIILDVPCSNTGVLNKRVEARWRLSQESIEKLKVIQLNLIKKAVTLLSDEGEIWYLTCSILKSENEALIDQACRDFNLKLKSSYVILPTSSGWDGGFGCILEK